MDLRRRSFSCPSACSARLPRKSSLASHAFHRGELSSTQLLAAREPPRFRSMASVLFRTTAPGRLLQAALLRPRTLLRYLGPYTHRVAILETPARRSPPMGRKEGAPAEIHLSGPVRAAAALHMDMGINCRRWFQLWSTLKKPISLQAAVDRERLKQGLALE